jgi:hypothetical protein
VVRPPAAVASVDPGITVAPAAEGAPVVSGTISGPGPTPLAGANVCLDRSDGLQNCVAFDQTAADGTYTIDAPAGSYHLRSWHPGNLHVPGYWSPTGYTSLEAQAGVITVSTSDIAGRDVTLPLFPFVRGTMTGSDGAPIEGLYLEGGLDAATTAADGTYAMRVWPGTSVKLMVNATLVHRRGWYSTGGFVTQEVDASSISVGTSDVTGVDLVVPTWARITGRVTDVHGDPVGNLTIRFTKQFEQRLAGTNDNGEYVFYAYFGGMWTGEIGGGDWIHQSHPVNGDADAVLDFEAHRYPVVSGTVVGPDMEPVPGIEIRLSGDGDQLTRTTGSDGTFSFTWLWPGATATVFFRDRDQGYVNGWLGDDGYTRRADDARPLQLDPDVSIDGSITMPAFVTLEGTVSVGGGGPVSGGTVFAMSPDDGSGSTASSPIASDGTYSMKLPPGRYTLSLPGGHYGAEGFAYESGAAALLEIGDDGKQLDIVLPATQRIRGRVTSGTTPLPGVEVDVYLDGYPFTGGFTAADGTYAIAVPPGAYLVGFYDPTRKRAHGWYGPTGYTSDPDAAKLVGVSLLDATGVNVSLPTTKRVAGKILRGTTTTVAPYVYIEAFVNGVFYSSQYAKSTGTFDLPVAPGKVTFWIYDPYFRVTPGWRTATSVSPNWASAVPTTVGSSNVSGLVIRSGTPVVLRVNSWWVPAPGTKASVDGYLEAVYNGAATSFSIDDASGIREIPLYKTSYRFWMETENDSPFSVLTDGWWKSTNTLTTDAAQASVRSVTANGTLSVVVPKGDHAWGHVVDRDGDTIAGPVHVQIWSQGSLFHTEVTQGGGFDVVLPPGTYRMAFVDAYARYRPGWLGPDGALVGTYAEAEDLVSVADVGLAGIIPTMLMGPPPAAPTGVSATPYHEAAAVSFTGVASTLTRPILHYAVTASPGGRQCITTGSACLVTGLTDGTPYTFTVTASSITGASAASGASTAVTPLAVPDAPSAITAIPTGADVTVTWTAPDDNGSPLTGYEARLAPGGASCMPSPATDPGCTIPGIPDGKYTVTVTATNALGTGLAGQAPVTVDTVAPTVTAPTVVLRGGVSMSGAAIPVTVSWTASDATSGIADTTLELAVGTGSYTDQALTTATATSLQRTLDSNSSGYRFRDLATDASGNSSPFATGASNIVTLRQETGTGITYAGSWATSSTSTALGGKLRLTSAKGASVTYTFTGRGVSFVVRKQSTAGKVAVYVDGGLAATLDLYSSATVVRYVAYVKMFPTSGKHTIKLVNLATSGRPRLYVDGFGTIR